MDCAWEDKEYKTLFWPGGGSINSYLTPGINVSNNVRTFPCDGFAESGYHSNLLCYGQLLGSIIKRSLLELVPKAKTILYAFPFGNFLENSYYSSRRNSRW